MTPFRPEPPEDVERSNMTEPKDERLKELREKIAINIEKDCYYWPLTDYYSDLLSVLDEVVALREENERLSKKRTEEAGIWKKWLKTAEAERDAFKAALALREKRGEKGERK